MDPTGAASTERLAALYRLQSECIFHYPPPAYLLVSFMFIDTRSQLQVFISLWHPYPIFQRIQPRLHFSLRPPLKATSDNPVPRKLMSYMLRHMHIESKVGHIVSRR